jgi:hypothetical protein
MTIRILVFGWFVHLKMMTNNVVVLLAILSAPSNTRGWDALILGKLFILMGVTLVLHVGRFLEY